MRVINNMTHLYEPSPTSVQSRTETSSHPTWCMQCFSLLYKVLGVCVWVLNMSLFGNVIQLWYSVKICQQVCVCLYADVRVFKVWTRRRVQRLIRLVVDRIIK